MTVLEIILLLTTIFFAFFSFKFAIIILRVQEAIEECLDAIDSKYRRLSEIIKIPVFFDSPEIKSIINEISHTKDIVLYVASRLSNSIGEKSSNDLLEEDSISTEED
jgi:hypothetical protein